MQIKSHSSRQKVVAVMQFYEDLLAGTTSNAGNKITLADIVAGTLVSSLSYFGFSLDTYPNLITWSQHLESRASRQQTAPKPEAIATPMPNIRAILNHAIAPQYL
jgi:glutathione S-transferase